MALATIEVVWNVSAQFTDRADDVIVRVYDFSNPTIPLTGLTLTTVETPETIGPGDAFSYTQYITHISGLPDDYEPGRAVFWINATGEDTMDPEFRAIPAEPLFDQVNYLKLKALALTVTPPEEDAPDPALCTVTGKAWSIGAQPQTGTEIVFRALNAPVWVDTALIYALDSTYLIGSDGEFSVSLLRGLTYRVTCPALGLTRRTVIVPDEETCTLVSLL